MIARSGISIEGSQLDLLLSNMHQLELNTIYIERFGAAAAQQASDKAKSIARGAQMGRVAGILSSFQSGGSAAYGAYSSGKGGGSTPSYSPSNPAPYGQGAGVLQPEYGGNVNVNTNPQFGGGASF